MVATHRIMGLAFVAFTSAALCAASAVEAVERTPEDGATGELASSALGERSRNFVPPDGRTLLFIGQDLTAIREYIAMSGHVPDGFMTYTSIQQMQGLDSPADYGAGVQHAQQLLEAYPGTALQVGLWMVGGLPPLNEGAFDRQIDQLADWVARTGRSVYLRIGYEFDLPANGYEPTAYVAAFRRIVDRFRVKQVANVAFVWHSWTNTISRPVMDWYPGDDYVDWFGISYFNPLQTAHAVAMATLAKAHGKPLMVAEATPSGIGTGEGEASWEQWFEPLLRFVQDYDVKALSYINWDWETIPMFRGQRWGDGRIQANKFVKSRWLAEMAGKRYGQAAGEGNRHGTQ